MNRFQYPVLLTPADEGGYVVTCRDLPQLVTQGETVQDSPEQASDAMDEVVCGVPDRGYRFSGAEQGQTAGTSRLSTGRDRCKGCALRRNASGGNQQGSVGEAARR